MARLLDIQCESKNPTELFSHFPQRLGTFSPNFTFLSIRWTTNFYHMHDGCSNLIRHNFVIVTDNWITIFSLAYIGTYNRHVKFGLKIPNRLGKMSENFRGIFYSHCIYTLYICSGLLVLLLFGNSVHTV